MDITSRIDIARSLGRNDYQLSRLRLEQQEAEQKLLSIQQEIDRVRAERSRLEGMRYSLADDLWFEIFDILILDEDPLELTGAEFTEAYYRPVTLSHVCKAWRELILSGHGRRYWTRILFRGPVSSKGAIGPLIAFARRSALPSSESLSSLKPPRLDLVFMPSQHTLRDLHILKEQIDFALSTLVFERPPWKSIAYEAQDPACIGRLIRSLSSFFPRLLSLRLALAAPSSGLISEATGETKVLMSGPFHLESLHLQHITPLRFPVGFYASLRRATLKYPGREQQLSLSHLTKFLKNTPVLESLTLHVAPAYDILIPNPVHQLFEGNHPNKPVLLHNLIELKWGFLHPKEVHHVLLFLSTPCLQSLTLYLHNTTEDYEQAKTLFLEKPLKYDSLKELHLHFVEASAMVWRLRSMIFPNLERLSIENDDFDTEELPDLPAFSSLLHIPVMPSVTHLSLFRVRLPVDCIERALACMPAVRVLKLESCRGVRKLLASLRVATVLVGKPAPVYPFLEELSIINIADLQFEGLAALIKERNTDIARPAGEASATPRVLATPRKIKALRKGVTGSPVRSPNVTVPKDVLDEGEEVRPLKITKVDVRGCPGVSREELESLWDLGVELVCGDRRGRWVTEVTWRSS
ncbi:hypothetical protein GLOTRDRAFT_125051 [Gloeophyllum trabeum ATCC 11539]|uniref:Uncharacterized protein n=1 Tax=Gloeophyllum trabeum (strain ATCC 11539 / FP-39264 / Madison 617) TaxID=670483 RepID=S7S1J9_GLOTA|nr:uncharacterized protein GLOTRDRAFT_125051 [Gloeophyllum trabeum ATCC 11539]EPQ61330.1 hypothetical protein GLOTRDRAFT_125051 [Gloeophyllum trabeum ATCC 11539]